MTLYQWVLLAQAFVFGLLIGSFLNVCIYRIPLKKSLLGRSYCPTCGRGIPFYRNVPVFAFLFQRGKSACCKTPISWQYPTVELLTGFLSVVTLWHSQNPDLGPRQNLLHYFLWFLLFVCPLITVSIIDLQLRIIPDVISLPGIGVGILLNLFLGYPDVWAALKFSGFGILAGGGTLLLIAEVFSRLLKKEAMGGGDIKLMAMLGAFLGWRAVFFIFFASSVLAMVYYILAAIVRRGRHDKVIPFGPFLSMAGLLYWFYGDALILGYLMLLRR